MIPSPFMRALTAAERARSLRDIDSAQESALDCALEATFPASDPLSVTQPGGGGQPSIRVIDPAAG